MVDPAILDGGESQQARRNVETLGDGGAQAADRLPGGWAALGEAESVRGMQGGQVETVRFTRSGGCRYGGIACLAADAVSVEGQGEVDDLSSGPEF